MEGDEYIMLPVKYFHSSSPVALIAYKDLSLDPTYIVPSDPIAGDESTSPPV